MTDDKTLKISGPLADLALVTITGTGKVTWPDGTEVSADQFQNAVTAAVTGFQKGQAAGRREALLEAADEQERLSTGPRALGNKAVRFKRVLFANWLRERAEEQA